MIAKILNLKPSRSAYALMGAGLLATQLALPAFAAGEREDPIPTCAKGQIWDQQRKQCVKQKSSSLPDENKAKYAYALAKAKRYAEALEVLDTMQNPYTSKALNYRGYATRKLGKTDEGIGYYLQSVALDPQYPRVREYLGEAYVVKGRLDLAEDQLGVIKDLCGKTCEEYEDLSAAIKAAGRRS